ncbi:hypothetical protein TNCV_4744041 [Trichonephila clavipes]|nr:hypothetical protein TNCV_4744041 [Trichonephila clavipes]
MSWALYDLDNGCATLRGIDSTSFWKRSTGMTSQAVHKSLDQREGDGRISCLPSTGRNPKVLSQDFWVTIEKLACYSPWFVQSIDEGDVHQGNIARWPTSVWWCILQLENKVINVVLQL